MKQYPLFLTAMFILLALSSCSKTKEQDGNSVDQTNTRLATPEEIANLTYQMVQETDIYRALDCGWADQPGVTVACEGTYCAVVTSTSIVTGVTTHGIGCYEASGNLLHADLFR